MIDWSTLREHAIGYRRTLVGLLQDEAARASVRPPTWRNNLHWHAGHLVLVPHNLTYSLARDPAPLPETYRRWFGRGTSPDDWGSDPIALYEQLVEDLVGSIERIFDDFEARADESYPEPYRTSTGIVLRTPAEALTFNIAHDGIHIGMIQALKRSLNAMA